MSKALRLAEQIVAVDRLTKLIVEDEITRPLRDAVSRWADGHDEGTLRERIEYAVGCGACSSVWAAAAVLVLSRSRPGRILVRVLALSGAALTAQAVTGRS